MKPGDGAMAELCVAEESSVLPLPGGVSDDLVAALGLSAIAAWTALTIRGGLQRGEHVLVLGASGTVGQVGVQAARRAGAARGAMPRRSREFGARLRDPICAATE
jgi:NADPH:quinone reductase